TIVSLVAFNMIKEQIPFFCRPHTKHRNVGA
ncbi:MAG: hypothetical protein ACI86L_001531, partial [Dokdonia sp.]